MSGAEGRSDESAQLRAGKSGKTRAVHLLLSLEEFSWKSPSIRSLGASDKAKKITKGLLVGHSASLDMSVVMCQEEHEMQIRMQGLLCR